MSKKPLFFKSLPSPNTDHSLVDVQFLILHYTACSLEKTLDLFQSPYSKVSSHWVIDETGVIFEIIPSLKPPPQKAFHAGVSRLQMQEKVWEDFNSCSIGIELINRNGNLFQYPKKQYQALLNLTLVLQEHYPILKNPDRILGHEHISGFRGKIDPGHMFPWNQYFSDIGLSSFPKRKGCLPEEIKERFEDQVKNLDESEKDWPTLNTMLEKQYQHFLKANN